MHTVSISPSFKLSFSLYNPQIFHIILWATLLSLDTQQPSSQHGTQAIVHASHCVRVKKYSLRVFWCQISNGVNNSASVSFVHSQPLTTHPIIIPMKLENRLINERCHRHFSPLSSM